MNNSMLRTGKTLVPWYKKTWLIFWRSRKDFRAYYSYNKLELIFEKLSFMSRSIYINEVAADIEKLNYKSHYLV